MERVQIGSLEHLLPIFLACVVGFILVKASKRYLSKINQYKIANILAIGMSVFVLSYHFYQIYIDSYNFRTDLPLYLCSFMALTIPIFTYYRKYWMYEILLFWIIAGTSQGVLTPDIPVGFPSFDYFRYWVVHLGLLIIIFYATFVFPMRPRFVSVFKSILVLQIYMGLIIIVNYILDANYSYLNYKPDSASALDYFGEWPYYILVVQLILIPYFLLIYLPFYLEKRKRNKLG